MKYKYFIILSIVAFAAVLCSPTAGFAVSILGSAQSFAVLGHESVTNAHEGENPTTQIYGNLGVTPGTSVTGFDPDGTVSGGTIHINDAVAQLALVDINTAYTTLAGESVTDNFTGNLAGRTLIPGVYTTTDSVALLNGVLNLNASGVPNARFVFQLPALTTGTAEDGTKAVVNVIGGDSGTEVYWVISSSATLGADTVFAGNILAYASVILDPRAEILCGRAFARTASVTLIDNLISNNNSAEDFGSGREDFGSYGFSGGNGGVAPIPEPSTMLLLGLGSVVTAFIRGRRKA